jgi:hypothetical protein
VPLPDHRHGRQDAEIADEDSDHHGWIGRLIEGKKREDQHRARHSDPRAEERREAGRGEQPELDPTNPVRLAGRERCARVVPPFSCDQHGEGHRRRDKTRHWGREQRRRFLDQLPSQRLPHIHHRDAMALDRANGTEMGLAGYFWSRDVARCWRIAERLEVGIVGVNNALPSVAFAPTGGVKQSELGREGADLGLEEFQDVRTWP